MIENSVCGVIPRGTGGMTGSVVEHLALTGIGVVGPFTITCPAKNKFADMLNNNVHTQIIIQINNCTDNRKLCSVFSRMTRR